MSKQTDKLILFNWSGAIEDDTYTGKASYRKKCLELLRFFESDIFTKFSDTYIFHYWSLHLEETMYLNASMPTSFEWFHSVSNDFNLVCDYLQFTKKMAELFDQIRSYQEMIDLACLLKDSCQTGIIGNITSMDLPRYHKWCDCCSFDREWFSCNIGILMPEKEFYQHIEEDCGLPAENILLIDSSQSNLDVGYERDWQTKLFLHENYGEVREACERFLG